MSKNIQIALVSKETLPVFYIINEFRPEEVFLVGTEETMQEMEQTGQTHQNYSDKNCNISNCKTLIINVLDLLILDIFRIFIV